MLIQTSRINYYFPKNKFSPKWLQKYYLYNFLISCLILNYILLSFMFFFGGGVQLNWLKLSEPPSFSFMLNLSEQMLLFLPYIKMRNYRDVPKCIMVYICLMHVM